MINKIKSISKRTLSLLLIILMLLSTGIVGTLAANVDFAETGATKELAATGSNFTPGQKVYLQMDVWNQGSEWIEAYLFGTSGNKWITMTKINNGTHYYFVVPSGEWDSAIFLRKGDASHKTEDWTCWNRTSDWSFDGYNNMCKITGWGSNNYATFESDQYLVTPNKPSVTITGSGITGGGTTSNPYKIPVGTQYSVNVSATQADPGMHGLAYSIGTTNSKEKYDGTYTETYTASTVTTSTQQYTGYAWAYMNKNASGNEKNYSTYSSNTVYYQIVAAVPKQPTVSSTCTAVTGDIVDTTVGSTADNPYRIPVGTSYNVNLTASSTSAHTGFEWSDGTSTSSTTTSDNGTNSYSYTAPPTASTASHTYSVKAVNGTYESDETTKTIYVEYYDYFKADDVVYFDLTGDLEWNYEHGDINDYRYKIFVKFTDATDSTDASNRAEMTQIGEYLYKYTFTENCYSDIRFWRGTDAQSFSYSAKLSKGDNNGIYHAENNVGEHNSGVAKKFSEFKLSTPTLTVSPSEVNKGTEATLSSNTSHTVYYKIDGVEATGTPATAVNYTFKVNGAQVPNDTTNPNTAKWTPTEGGDYTIALTVALDADPSIKGENSVTPVVVSDTTYTLTITEIDATGGTVEVGGATAEGGSIKVSPGSKSLKITAPYGCYIVSASAPQASFTGGTYKDTEVTLNITVTGDAPVTITYDELPVYTITTETVGDGQGSIIGPTSVVYNNDATFEALPQNTNYQFVKWTVKKTETGVDVTDNSDLVTIAGSSLTLKGVKQTYTVIAEFIEKQNATVTLRAPKSQGSAEGKLNSSVVIDTDSSKAPANTYEATKGSQITFTAKANSGYEFLSWKLDGGKIVNGSISTATITVEVTDDFTLEAQFKGGNRTVYAKNKPSGWDDTLYVFMDKGDGNKYYPMTKDGDTWYLEDVPPTLTWIKFIDNTNNDNTQWQYQPGGDKTIFWEGDTFDLNNKKVIDNQGVGDTSYSVNYGSNSYLLDDYGDGEYVASFVTDKLTNTSFSFTVKDKSNSTLSTTNVSELETNRKYKVYVKFDPSNNTVTYNTEALPETIIIYGTKGAQTTDGSSSTNSVIENLGTTSFNDPEDIVDVIESSSEYTKVEAIKGRNITIQTQIVDKYKSTYLVQGWVINGVRYVKADSSLNTEGLFTGTIEAAELTEEINEAIPVYFHNSQWLNDNGLTDKDGIKKPVKMIKVYVNTKEKDSNWGNYVSCYTWNVKQQPNVEAQGYRQQGFWPGQVMIPEENTSGLYYTFVEQDSKAHGDVKGILFTNFKGNSKIENLTQWLQTFDFYEFVSLADQGMTNIVCEFKPGLGDINKSDNIPKSTNSSNNLTTYGISNTESENDDLALVDIDGDMYDVFRNKLTEEQKAATTPGLYVVRTGPNDKTSTSDTTIDGSYYVDCFVYDSNRKYLGRCKSYELVNFKLYDPFKMTEAQFTALEGKKVIIAYETKNTESSDGARTDAEWFGYKEDATRYIDVVVGVTDGNASAQPTIAVDATTNTYTNIADYGTAYVMGDKQSYQTTTGATNISMTANPIGKYKFHGWYEAIKAEDGTITIDYSKRLSEVTTNNIEIVSKSNTYVAVFRPVKEGSMWIYNYFYEGGYDGPTVMGGNMSDSTRSIKYELIDKNGVTLRTDDTLDLANSYECEVDLTEDNIGDTLRITIVTTPNDKYLDYVYAWYEKIKDENGNVIGYEEVGLDTKLSEIPGKTEQFTFEYTIKGNDESIYIYSDVAHFTGDVTLIYRYHTRPQVGTGEPKSLSYYVNHTLLTSVTEEDGTVVNERKEGRPANATISDNAPYIADIFTNVSWTVADVSKDGSVYYIDAGYPDYTLTIVGLDRKPIEHTGPFNTSVSLMASDYKDNNGFWYLNKDDDTDYNAEVDTILGYGRYYGLVITGDATIGYYQLADGEELDYNIVLNEAVEGREQATDKNGIITHDKLYHDFLINYHIPHFTFDKVVDVNNKEVTLFDPNNADAPVSLEVYAQQTGYVIDYGTIVELINTKEENHELYNDQFTSAEQTAFIELLTTKSIYEHKDNPIQWDATNGYITGSGYNPECGGKTYYNVFSAKALKNPLTNKNRVLMTMATDNMKDTQDRFFNVVAYLAIYTPDGELVDIYFSNQQNYHTILSSDALTLE